MPYQNEATKRNRLHRQWIDQEDRPCAYCGAHGQREIHRVRNGKDGGTYREDNCVVLCFHCHHKIHANSKFRIGDKVKLSPRQDKYKVPDYIDLDRSRPRTIIAVRYDKKQQCNFYRLGSNSKGTFASDGNPLNGFTQYKFRSYQLVKYEPRRYHFKRKYNHKNQSGSTTPLNPNPDSQDIVGQASRQVGININH